MNKWKPPISGTMACHCQPNMWCLITYAVVDFLFFLWTSTATLKAVNCELCYILWWGMDRTVSCVARLEPLLLLTQALSHKWNECQPNPNHGVAYMEPACKILWSHFLASIPGLRTKLHPIYWPHLFEHTCLRVSSLHVSINHTPCVMPFPASPDLVCTSDISWV